MPTQKLQLTAKMSQEKTSNSDLDLFTQAKNHFWGYAKALCPDFTVDAENKETIETLILYALRSPLFEERGKGLGYNYSLSKGIFLAGNIGSGKSLLMRILSICRFEGFSFMMKDTRQVTEEFMSLGYDVLSRYGRQAVCFRSQQKVLKHALFDDLGSESPMNYFGNEVNVMEQVILNRYGLFQMEGLLSHFTTNLDIGELQVLYGNRVYSRLYEMCNFLPLGGSANATDRRIAKAKHNN